MTDAENEVLNAHDERSAIVKHKCWPNSFAAERDAFNAMALFPDDIREPIEKRIKELDGS